MLELNLEVILALWLFIFTPDPTVWYHQLTQAYTAPFYETFENMLWLCQKFWSNILAIKQTFNFNYR